MHNIKKIHKDISEAIARHDKVVLQFSGGKDSTAVLELCRPFLDKITAVFVDSGAAFPHIVDFVYAAVQRVGAKFEVVRPLEPQPMSLAKYGLPSDMVPTNNTDLGHYLAGTTGVKIQPWTECCRRNLWQPMANYLAATGATLVIRGQRDDEAHKGVKSGHIENGVECLLPIEGWTKEDVFAYLDNNTVPMLEQYPEISDGLDCYSCTGWLHFTPDEMKPRLEFVKRNYPLQYKKLLKNLRSIHGVARVELDRLESLYEGVE